MGGVGWESRPACNLVGGLLDLTSALLGSLGWNFCFRVWKELRDGRNTGSRQEGRSQGHYGIHMRVVMPFVALFQAPLLRQAPPWGETVF